MKADLRISIKDLSSSFAAGFGETCRNRNLQVLLRSGKRLGSLPQDDPKQRKPDITKARKILKWEPKIRRTVADYSDLQPLFELTRIHFDIFENLVQ